LEQEGLASSSGIGAGIGIGVGVGTGAGIGVGVVACYLSLSAALIVVWSSSASIGVGVGVGVLSTPLVICPPSPVIVVQLVVPIGGHSSVVTTPIHPVSSCSQQWCGQCVISAVVVVVVVQNDHHPASSGGMGGCNVGGHRLSWFRLVVIT
jgi:hypothetical protein